LPEDTETLIVVPLGFELPKLEPITKDEKTNNTTIDVSEAIQFLPTGQLFNLKDELFHKELAGQKVLCVVEGSRRFTRPGEFGLMPYEGCHIVMFDPDADDTLKKAFRAGEEKADKKIELADVRVAIFTEKQNCDTWSFFVCRPRPGILICATNQEYLEETLKRIDKPHARRALPSDLPEWKHVDVKARVWAIRHYRKDFAKEDPSSPLNPGGNDPDAVGFVFWIAGDSGNVANVRYLSRAKDALKIATTAWDHKSEGVSAKIKQGEKGVVEIAISILKDENAAMFLFVLMMHLGHGIVV
jgi:hypothetical protein